MLRLFVAALLCAFLVHAAPHVNDPRNSSAAYADKSNGTNPTEVEVEKQDTLLDDILTNTTAVELEISPAELAENETTSSPPSSRPNLSNKGILTYIAFGIAIFISLSTLTFYAWESFCKKKPAHHFADIKK
uniref:Si:ch73-389k6.1 n=1 Tax=Steinernema glaseri TaxID=37863 RepID=A0A1I7YFY5_9BILA